MDRVPKIDGGKRVLCNCRTQSVYKYETQSHTRMELHVSQVEEANIKSVAYDFW